MFMVALKINEKQNGSKMATIIMEERERVKILEWGRMKYFIVYRR